MKMKNKTTKDNKLMEDRKSSFDLLRGSGTFTNEPNWFKLAVILIEVLFLLALAWMLREWALGAILAKLASRIRLLDLFKGIKGRSP
jgi:hypothetical protein